MTSTPSLAYRKAALQHASTVGLVIALYDTLLGNLSRAGDAMERQDIEGRCTELVHGFKVLQQLEVMLNMSQGGPTALNLRRFYTHMRGQMLTAQFKQSAAILHQQIKSLLEVREAWQQVDARGTQQAASHIVYTSQGDPASKSIMQQRTSEMETVTTSFSCSG